MMPTSSPTMRTMNLYNPEKGISLGAIFGLPLHSGYYLFGVRCAMINTIKSQFSEIENQKNILKNKHLRA